MYTHLELSKNNSKSRLWASANKEIMDRIEEPLTIRREAANKESMQVQDEELRQENKIKLKQQERKEAISVQKMIEGKARAKAVKEVKAEEDTRQVLERVEIAKKIFTGEERQVVWYRRIAVAFIILIVVVCAVVKGERTYIYIIYIYIYIYNIIYYTYI